MTGRDCTVTPPDSPLADVAITGHDGWPRGAEVVDQGLDASNALAAPLHEVRQIACIARSGSGEVIGGALGRWWGAGCELQELWVHPGHRRAGLGRRLVLAFEQLAARNGCTSVYLETFSFQSPGLYTALGYTTQYRRDGFPHGIVKHHMVKSLPASLP